MKCIRVTALIIWAGALGFGSRVSGTSDTTASSQAIEAIHGRLARVATAAEDTAAPRRTLGSKRAVASDSLTTGGQALGMVGEAGGVLCSQSSVNCQAQDNAEGLTSDRTSYLVADDFRPDTSGNINKVCWWGAYYDGTGDCRGVSTDTFRIRYFADAGGVPGTLLRSFSQATGSLTVSGPVATGAMVAGRVPEYEYAASHTAFSVAAGQCYWIEISNSLSDCTWFWEAAVPGDDWALQDGDGVTPPDGYAYNDSTGLDLAFCAGIALSDSHPCIPPPPPNNHCADAQSIQGEGIFSFDNSTATTDGPAHNDCLDWGEDQIESDVWYCWTAPCTDTAFVATCGLTEVDTRIAAYEGCGCPPADQNILACNDDICGAALDPRQSMIYFPVTEGQKYLIRVGNFPGGRRGSGSFKITCGPPDNPACPGTVDCCVGGEASGCSDETCCETVCACDEFCCVDFWDESCATYGFQNSGCGALYVCGSLCGPCGKPEAGSCCAGHATPGCSDLSCCETVCSYDSYCCEVEWDQNCATTGYDNNGYGAQVLCPDVCSPCPAGPVTFVDPLDGVIDARQPYPPGDANARQGIDSLIVQGPTGIERLGCWSLCETAVDGVDNGVMSVDDNGNGTFTVHLARSISTGAVTTVTYTAGTQTEYTGRFTSHPANVNGDGASSPVDILAIIDALNGVATPPWGLYSRDVDHSGLAGPADILRVIDLLNGADQFDPWLGRTLPQCGTCCP